MKTKKKKIILMTIICTLICGVSVSDKLTYGNEKFKGTYERKFKDYVVFYPQHQDDEVLWGGSAIRKAIHERGFDKVFVVLISDGIGVNVFNNEKYKNVSIEKRKELRDNEFRASLKRLGVREENTIILSNIDKNQNKRFELMKKVALEFENRYKSVTHIAQSYKYDDHPLHKKNGEVIYELYKSGQIKDTLFFLKPKYVDKVPSENIVLYDSTTVDDYNAVKDACMEYKIIDSKNDRDGIGYISAHSYFEYLLNDEKLTSILHLPY